jgi:hypothetical protein
VTEAWPACLTYSGDMEGLNSASKASLSNSQYGQVFSAKMKMAEPRCPHLTLQYNRDKIEQKRLI